MAPFDPPPSLALDDIMLLDDDEERSNSSDHAKLSDIQEQLQKQAELIKDLITQRDFLIAQILEERSRWQAEREGWDRVSEALLSRHARKGTASVKDEELEHRCALYESDNRTLKDRLHDTHIRLTSLEVELSKLKPLLTMQPNLSSQRQQSRINIAYPYTQVPNYMSPFNRAPAFPTVPYHTIPSMLSTTPTTIVNSRGRKRKRNNPADVSSTKGKEREPVPDDISDPNVDGDSDNTEAPPTPTPTASTYNPYAYMNELYRQVLSPPKSANSSSSAIKPPNTVGSNATVNNPSGAIALSPYPVLYTPYTFMTSNLSNPPSSSTSAAPIPLQNSRLDPSDNIDQGSAQLGTTINAQDTFAKQDKLPSSKPASTNTRRMTATIPHRLPNSSKHRPSSIMSDARCEHLLLAARKIGRERAAAIAGIIGTQEKDKPVAEGVNKGKPKAVSLGKSTEAASPGKGSAVASARSPTQQRSRTITSSMITLHSPSTPTPKRVQGLSGVYASPLTDIPSAGVTPTTCRTPSTSFSSTAGSRSGPMVSTTEAKILSIVNEDSGSPQTALDSLLSAARTMLSEVHEGGRIAAGQSVVTADAVSSMNEVMDRHRIVEANQAWVETGATGAEDDIAKRKRRRSTNARAATTPRSKIVNRNKAKTSNAEAESQSPDKFTINWEADLDHPSKRVLSGIESANSTPSGGRARSALDVLADQAAAAFESSSAGHTRVLETGGDDKDLGERISAPHAGPLMAEMSKDQGSLEMSFLRDREHTPTAFSSEETYAEGLPPDTGTKQLEEGLTKRVPEVDLPSRPTVVRAETVGRVDDKDMIPPSHSSSTIDQMSQGTKRQDDMTASESAVTISPSTEITTGQDYLRLERNLPQSNRGVGHETKTTVIDAGVAGIGEKVESNMEGDIDAEGDIDSDNVPETT
ncbi:hypothetical protein AX17_006093 [Amanita inopinata Kibby_2008]|nr:hypothetical protein AX17_006093 [Amanita inopinata Kibby_2008]